VGIFQAMSQGSQPHGEPAARTDSSRTSAAQPGGQNAAADTAADAAESPPIESFFDDQIKSGLADLAARSLQVLWPDKVVGCPPVGKYDAVMHARVCRAKLFGLSDRAAATAAGISYDMLSRWRERFPGLKADMEMAAMLSVEHAVMLLRGLMHGKGPTALQSIKFFLRTHSPEFQEKQRIEVQVDHKETMRIIRENLYGLPAEASASLSGAGAFAPLLEALPVLDALPAGDAPVLAVLDVAAEAASASKASGGAFAPSCGAFDVAPALPAAPAIESERLDLSAMVGVDCKAAQAVRMQPEESRD
jgi:hypothetical protein